MIVGLNDGIVGQWLGDGPDMVRQVGRAVDEVAGEEKGDGIEKDGGHGS